MARVGLQRLASQVRLVISDAIQNKLSDPRLERIASVTRVELSPDLSFADIYISVMGTESQQKVYMKGLAHAHGVLQSLVARKLRTRTCPSVRLHLDQSLKKGFETIRMIDQAMEELDGGHEGQADDDILSEQDGNENEHT